MRSSVRCCLTLTLGALVSCAEGTGPLARRSGDLSIAVPSLTGAVPAAQDGPSLAYAVGDPPPDMPPEFNVPAGIDYSNTDILLTETMLGAVATMNFFANVAEQSMTVKLSYKNQPIGSFGPYISADQVWYPRWSTLETRAEIPLSKPCGHHGHAESVHSVKNEYTVPTMGVWPISSAKNTSAADADQAFCPDSVVRSTQTYLESGANDRSIDSGGAWYICYTDNYYRNGVLVKIVIISCTQF